MSELRMSFDLPTAGEFVNLRSLVGMSGRDIAGAKRGLANSNCMITFRDGKLLIGMGRVIGDGATTFQIADMAVHPNYQGKGIGKAIMKELVDWLEENASPNSYVSLVADGSAKFLYEKFGFIETESDSIGMYRFIN